MPGGKQAGSSNIHIEPLALGDINNKWRVLYRFSTKPRCFSCDLVSSSVCLALEFQASPARIISSMQCFCCSHQAVFQPNKREFSSESWLWKPFQGLLIQETARWSWVLFSDMDGTIRWSWVTIVIGAQLGTESGGWVLPLCHSREQWKRIPSSFSPSTLPYRSPSHRQPSSDHCINFLFIVFASTVSLLHFRKRRWAF